MSTNQAEFYRGLEQAGAALRQCGAAAPAVQAAAVHAALQPLLADTDDAQHLACGLGCSHCCHFPVGVSYPEAMRLATVLQAKPELANLVQCAAQATAAHSWQQLVGQPCPLLQNDICSVHEARPMPCRALGSRDAEACADALHTDRAPPRDEAAWWRGLGAAHALAEAEPSGSRELRSAVDAILRSEGADPAAAFRSSRPTPDV